MPCDYTKYPPNWQEMRQNAISKADHKCQGCGVSDMESGSNITRLTVHHPDRDPSNKSARLTVLCASCHLIVEPNARRRERIHASMLDGESVTDAWIRAYSGCDAQQIKLEI